jgi:hypothetical protein
MEDDNEFSDLILHDLFFEFIPPPPSLPSSSSPVGSISDPWYSRLIDVHRWSDHPEVAKVVQAVWDEHFAGWERPESMPGPKPKSSFKKQLRVLLLDLFVAWLEDPELCIGVSMSANAWDTNSRYNALHLSKKIIDLVKRLEEVGLIDVAKGSYSGRGAMTNRTTRIRASQPLQGLFGGVAVRREDIQAIDTQECIILKDGLLPGDGTKLYDYKDTDETNRMREELRAYNRVLANSFIDIPILEEAVCERPDRYGRTFKQPLDHHHHFVRRIFSRGKWDLNGRFYGAWWQLIPSSLRKEIYINDTPTVEVDFKGLHVSILSAEKGLDLDGDPYTLEGYRLPETPQDLQRNLLKHLVLTALNARDRKSAFQSFRDNWPAGTPGKQMSNAALEAFLSAFTDRYPHLKEFMCADQGIRLMNVDGRIAERVHAHFTAQGVPVLSVHDSFIVDYTRVGELKRVMADASKEVVGRALPVSAKALGLDEMEVAYRTDYVAWFQTPRTLGFIERMKDWEDKTGAIVVPYDKLSKRGEKERKKNKKEE